MTGGEDFEAAKVFGMVPGDGTVPSDDQCAVMCSDQNDLHPFISTAV
jgi:hypothetical protein